MTVKGTKRPEDQILRAVENRTKNRIERLLRGPFEDVPKFRLKERVLFEQDGKCALCGMPPFWNGQPLTFQLDHIQGRQHGDGRANLRVICPNCHSQTPTFTSKNASAEGRVRMRTRQARKSVGRKSIGADMVL